MLAASVVSPTKIYNVWRLLKCVCKKLEMYKKYKDAPTLCLVKWPLTLLHSERPKLYGVLAVLSAAGLTCILCLWPRHCRNVAKSKNHETSGCTTFGRKPFRWIRQYVDATYRRIRQFVDYDNPLKFRRKMSKFRRQIAFIRRCIANIAASGISIRRAPLLVNNNAILRSPSISLV